MGKPSIYKGENKGADHLRSNCEADMCLVFAARIVQSFFFLNQNCMLLACICDYTVSDLVGTQIVGFLTRTDSFVSLCDFLIEEAGGENTKTKHIK